VLLAQGGQICAADLGLRPGSGEAAARIEEMSLEDVERMLIQNAMQRHDGNVSHAARALGLSRSGLYRRIQKYGL
jgi:transcriptional regulator of acetoin/glycerol metabolism